MLITKFINFFKNLKSIFSSKLSFIRNNSIYLGVVKGMTVPLLPKRIDSIYNHIFVRILRFIGGVCLISNLTNFTFIFPRELQFIVIILGLLQSIQILFISIIKLKLNYLLKKLKFQLLKFRH